MSLPYAKMLCDVMLCSGSKKKVVATTGCFIQRWTKRKDNINLNVFLFVVDDKIKQNKRKLS